ncbi:MAG: acyl-CoA dehydrogenase [Pseudomonadota bacterium]
MPEPEREDKRMQASEEIPQAWRGRLDRSSDAMDPFAANALGATLDLGRAPFRPGDALPPFWHWLYFPEAAPRASLGRDGHPAPGWSLPATGLPRRMWAGGRLVFRAPLPLGAPAERVTKLGSLKRKEGRSGPLAFVTMRREIAGAAGPAVTEEQDIVYRQEHERAAPAPDAPAAPPAPSPAAGWSQHWQLDETVLFRYSALTFNGHRIHYDAAYAREVEGYAGLVVHGPLLATLLLELAAAAAPDRFAPFFRGRFAFRAASPVIAGEPFTTHATRREGGLDLWVSAGDAPERLAMTAEVGWDDVG